MPADFLVYMAAIGVGALVTLLVRRQPASALAALALAAVPIIGVGLQMTLVGDG